MMATLYLLMLLHAHSFSVWPAVLSGVAVTVASSSEYSDPTEGSVHVLTRYTAYPDTTSSLTTPSMRLGPKDRVRSIMPHWSSASRRETS